MAGASIFDSGLAAVNQMVSALWRDGIAAAQDNLPYQIITSDLGKSNAKIRAFDFMGAVGEVREATREPRTRQGVRRFNMSITHREWMNSLEVRVADLETDQLGQIPPLVNVLSRKAMGHPGRLALNQIESNPTAYDGTAFFADTRAFGDAANVDNSLAGNGVTATDIETDIALARSAMKRFEDDTGEVLELDMDTLVIPPELSLVFGKVLGPTREAGGVDNQLGVSPPNRDRVWTAGGYTVLELGRLSDTNNWYGFHTGGELKPFVYSWVLQPRIINQPSFNDDSVKNRGVLEYVTYGIYDVGTSLPQYGLRVVN